jgi:hypothetical protein
MSDETPNHGPLPKFDSNAALEEASIQALKGVLAPPMFIVMYWFSGNVTV